MKTSEFGKTGLNIPPIVFGTSALGNLYAALDYESKVSIVKECILNTPKPVVFDSAGKYGAGLSLEMLGKCLKQLYVKPDEVIISNKLGWLRTELKTPEPTFEVGVWYDLKHDAIQCISYEGILKCWEQGNELLLGYKPQLVSVHDPDEYLATAKTEEERKKLFADILGAYQALEDLKTKGEVKAIGVGSKDWRVIKEITDHIDLDWVMFANSFTIMQHPVDLIEFMQDLSKKGVGIINSAVFHGGFLLGSDYFDYKLKSVDKDEDKPLYEWRDKFIALCRKYSLSPTNVCVNYGMTAPGVKAIALNTSKPQNIKKNVEAVTCMVPREFYMEMAEMNLLS